MPRPRKTLTVPAKTTLPPGLRDPWINTGDVQMQDGTQASRWVNSETDEVRLTRHGLHPEDQPLSTPMHSALAPVGLDDQDGEGEEVEETATDRVMTLLQSARGEGRAELNVYRMVNGERQYCAKFRPEEFEEGSYEMLRQNYGAGEYELRLYATDPRNGRFVVRSQTRIKIAESKAPAAGDALPSGLAQVLSTIAQGQEQMLRALVEIKQAPPKDPMEEMTKMLSMMTMMREAMGLNVAQSREKSSIGEIVAAIKELKGAAAEFAPEEKEPESLMGMLPKVLEMVSSGQQAQQAQQMPPGFAAGIPAVQVPPAMQTSTMQSNFDNVAQMQQPSQSQGDDVNLMTMLKLKGYLTTLVSMAQAGKPVEQGAQFVYDKLPDDLIEIMALDGWFELLGQVAPEVKPAEAWLRQVRDAALAMFDQGDEGPEGSLQDASDQPAAPAQI